MHISAYKYDENHFPELRIIFDKVLNQLFDNMSLREKVMLAALPEGLTSLLKRLLTFQVRCKFPDQWIDKNLMIDCPHISGQKESQKNDLAEMIVDELCRKLRDTCRLRVVK